MDSFTVKTGNRREPIQRTLKDSAGVVVNLTGATVKFRMRTNRPAGTGSFKVDTTATIVNAPGTDGLVKYSWAAIDVDTPGAYRGWFQVTFGDGTVQTFPNDGWILVNVTP
jgi:hypothetical protein